MKNMIRKLSIGMITSMLLAFICSISILNYIIGKDINEQLNSLPTKGEIMITDTYDDKNHSIFDFFERKNSKIIMKNTYNKLKSNPDLTYFEVSRQMIGYVGMFDGGREFAIGESKEEINQNIDGQTVTNLKALQIDNNYQNYINLKYNIEYGKSIKNKSYDTDDVIPVIVGSKYKEMLKIGDEFEGLFLGSEKLKFVVTGILKDEYNISLNGEEINTEYYVIMPNINASKKDSELTEKIILSIKCEGYLHYENKEEYERSIQILDEICNETRFKYSIPTKNLNIGIMGKTNYKTYIISFVLSTSIIIIILIKSKEKYNCLKIDLLGVMVGIIAEAVYFKSIKCIIIFFIVLILYNILVKNRDNEESYEMGNN